MPEQPWAGGCYGRLGCSTWQCELVAVYHLEVPERPQQGAAQGGWAEVGCLAAAPLLAEGPQLHPGRLSQTGPTLTGAPGAPNGNEPADVLPGAHHPLLISKFQANAEAEAEVESSWLQLDGIHLSRVLTRVTKGHFGVLHSPPDQGTKSGSDCQSE